MKRFIVAIGAIAAFAFGWMHPVYAADLGNGAKLFNANCTACHIGGNNVIIANKTLKKEALEKFGMNSLEAIKQQVINGKNAMPSFKARLSEAQIEDIANYVLAQSQNGW